MAARAARLAARASLRAAAAAPAATAALVAAERPAACLPLASTSFFSPPSAPAGSTATDSFSGGAATPSAAGAAPAVETGSGMRRKMYARKLRPLPAHAAGGVQHGTFGSCKTQPACAAPLSPTLLVMWKEPAGGHTSVQDSCSAARLCHPLVKPSLNHN